MDFVLRLYDCGLCGYRLISYVDLLLNKIGGVLCGCGLVSRCEFVWYVDFII